jgi:hypothetical protein
LWYYRLPNDGSPPTWEHFVLIIVARFGPQITLGGGSSATKIPGGGNNLAVGNDALFMGNDSVHKQPRVSPHIPAQEKGHSSNGSATLDTCVDVILVTDSGGNNLTGPGIGANRCGT